jgi:hypothetical protein
MKAVLLTAAYKTILSVNQAMWRGMIQCQWIMNCKDVEGSRHDLSRYYSAICLEEMKTTKVSVQLMFVDTRKRDF